MSRLLYGVKSNRREIIWWPKAAASLEEAASFKSQKNVFSVMGHKKCPEFAVCLADGSVFLLNPDESRIVSRIDTTAGAKIETVWCGLAALKKVAHLLVLVYDLEKAEHFLRVIRVSFKTEGGKESRVLEHVCAHLLVPPGAKGKKNRVLRASFDGVGLVLSCLWSSGSFCSYRFEKTKYLAAEAANLGPKSGTVPIQIASKLLPMTSFTKYKHNHVCFVVQDKVLLFNTLYGTVVGEPMTVPELIQDDGPLIKLTVASNYSFFIVATKSKLLRISMPEPDTSCLIHCVDTAVKVAAIFGPQSQELEQGDFILDFGEEKNASPVARPLDTSSSLRVPPPHELSSFLESHRHAGLGYSVRGPWPLSHRRLNSKLSTKRIHDRYKNLSPDFATLAIAEYVQLEEWGCVDQILRAQLSGVPPANLVTAAIEAKSNDVLRTLVELYDGMTCADLTSTLVYACQQGSLNQTDKTKSLLASIVRSQKITFTLDLEPEQLQLIFTRLVSLFASHGSLCSIGETLSVSALVEWCCYILDSNPQTFALDPEMQALVKEFNKRVAQEVKHSKILNSISVALDVIDLKQIPVTDHDTGGYSIEYFN